MKKLYLVETNATREFWTVEMLPEGDPEHFYKRTSDNLFSRTYGRGGDPDVVAVLRALYSNESVDANDASGVEDDSSWEIVVALTAEEFEHLFDDIKILDERDFQ